MRGCHCLFGSDSFLPRLEGEAAFPQLACGRGPTILHLHSHLHLHLVWAWFNSNFSECPRQHGTYATRRPGVILSAQGQTTTTTHGPSKASIACSVQMAGSMKATVRALIAPPQLRGILLGGHYRKKFGVRSRFFAPCMSLSDCKTVHLVNLQQHTNSVCHTLLRSSPSQFSPRRPSVKPCHVTGHISNMLLRPSSPSYVLQSPTNIVPYSRSCPQIHNKYDA